MIATEVVITPLMKELMNPEYITQEKITELRAGFDRAQPYKHLSLDGFLKEEVANQLYGNFPKLEKLKVKRKSLNENKSEDYHFDQWQPIFQKVRNLFRSEA